MSVAPEYRYCPHCTAPLRDTVIDGEPRRACSAGCGFVHWNNPTPVVAAIVEHEGMIVLARNRAWEKAWYGLITGFLEQGESPAQGAMREVGEELGLRAESATLVGIYPHLPRNQVVIGYHVPARGRIVLNHELVDYRRVPPDECWAWETSTGLLLRDWLRGRGYEPRMVAWR